MPIFRNIAYLGILGLLIQAVIEINIVPVFIFNTVIPSSYTILDYSFFYYVYYIGI